MTIIKSTIHDGRLRLDEPVNLPEGTEVQVIVNPLSQAVPPRPLTDEDQGDSPEAIARWIAYFESLTPPVMSDIEWAAWEQRRREDREWELAHEAERAEKLQRMFE